MEDHKVNSAWFKKGATFSDKSARKEFGLTQEEIIEGIEDGKLHYRINSVFGNPYYKIIRSEVETFIEKYGSNDLKKKNQERVGIGQQGIEDVEKSGCYSGTKKRWTAI